MSDQKLFLYNTLSRKKEEFIPMVKGYAGIYLCGPTVYGPPHLGHSRPAIIFDVLNRYLQHTGYKVRYVRNITDVGHLENDADEGEDKIAKKARVEKLEPMEIAQLYSNAYHDAVNKLNTLPPSIEPQASGHIIEQIAMIEKIIANGFAYESKGSVYFDVIKYNSQNNYGKLSGRVIDDLIAGAGNERRELEGQEEKRNPLDFALWKKASPEHIMHWPSPWSEGFPGWHIECSAMSGKYLGETFDIHCGGMDLLFPHHECEIAQSVGATGKDPVRYWVHNNMITINGQKMGKSLGNFVNLDDLFTGNNNLLEKAYSPMTIRFFILQAHYRSTLDFSNEGFLSAEKGLKKLYNAIKLLNKLKTSDSSTTNIEELKNACYAALNDDLNTAIVIANLFEGVRIINSVYAGTETISANDLAELKSLMIIFTETILGMKSEESDSGDNVEELMSLIIDLRKDAKTKKDFAASDKIREELNAIGFQIKDEKEGTTWSRN